MVASLTAWLPAATLTGALTLRLGWFHSVPPTSSPLDGSTGEIVGCTANLLDRGLIFAMLDLTPKVWLRSVGDSRCSSVTLLERPSPGCLAVLVNGARSCLLLPPPDGRLALPHFGAWVQPNCPMRRS